MRQLRIRLAVAALLLFLGISSYLLLIDELVALVAWWFVIAVFSPMLLLSGVINSFSLHIFMGMAFVTQIISVPFFVINRDRYEYSGWNAVKDFSFTIPEFVSIYSLVAFFLVVVVCSVGFLHSVFRLRKFRIEPNLQKPVLDHAPPQEKKGVRAGFYLILLITAVLLLIPLNLWMFRNGISLVGVEPPRLPYKLSGILHYFTKYVAPLVLALIYAKTSRSYVPACVLLGYAFLLGASHISRSSVVFLMLPVVFFAVLDRKHVLVSLAVVYGLVSTQLITLLRGLVYFVSDGGVGAETTVGLLEILRQFGIVSQLEGYSVADPFTLIIDRIEGAQGIVLAYQFNADAIGGVRASFQRFFYHGWVPTDGDAYHLEWIGITLPYGFVSGGGGLLSASLAITQSQPLYMALFGALVAIFIVLGEIVSRAIGRKYKTPLFYYVAGGIYTLFFYIGSGSTWFLGLSTILVITAVMPNYSQRSLR